MCILQTLGQSLRELKKKEKKNAIVMLRNKRKCNHTKCLIKTTKGRKSAKDKNRNKGQGRQQQKSQEMVIQQTTTKKYER